VIIVPEQMGKSWPVSGAFTMKAPVLRNWLFESTNPYVIAEARGTTNRREPIKSPVVKVKKAIRRFILSSLFLEDGMGDTGTP
jgi:hypothetical protein